MALMSQMKGCLRIPLTLPQRAESSRVLCGEGPCPFSDVVIGMEAGRSGIGGRCYLIPDLVSRISGLDLGKYKRQD